MMMMRTTQFRVAFLGLVLVSLCVLQSSLLSLTKCEMDPVPATVVECDCNYNPVVSTTKNECKYREYPDPAHQSGLPFLADVFASDNGTSVYFVTVNKGGCMKEWQFIQEFHTIRENEPHFFMCSFPDGSVTLSDRVHRKGSTDFLWSNALMVIRCPIPPQYHQIARKRQSFTTFTVSLHATENLEAKTKANGAPSQSFRDIPVCHGEWPQPNGKMRPEPADRFKVSLTTRLLTSYQVNGYTKALTITKEMVVAWIEYHLAIGFEQFYIFDHDHEQHGVLETWLRPYMEKGIVTYVWFPFKDCIRDFDVAKDRYLGNKGSQWRIGQYVTTNAALRRYSHQTEWMAHWDVDEYFVLPDNVKTVGELLDQQNDETIDAFTAKEIWYSVCDGDPVRPDMLPSERAKCYKDDTTPPKSIMKTSRVLYFLVHHPYATIDGKPLKVPQLDSKKAHLAHYRRRTFFTYDAPGFSGTAESSFKLRRDVLGKWTDYLKKKTIN